MRIGIHAAKTGRLAEPAAIRAVAIAAEQLGYSTLWAAGQPAGGGGVRGRDSVDPLEVLNACATVTCQVGLGIGVVVGSRYLPTMLGPSLRSLDALSGGRVTVGLRAPVEHLATHLDLLAPLDLERGRRLRVLVDASSEAELDLVGRRADGWIAGTLPVARFAQRRVDLLARAAMHGRDPATLHVIMRADVVLTDRPIAGDRAVCTGDVGQVVDDLVAIGHAGADEVILRVMGARSLDELLATYAELVEAVGARVPIGR